MCPFIRFISALSLLFFVSSAYAQNHFWGSAAALPGGPITYSSPAVADIDGNPVNGLETAIAGDDGILYVVRSNGSLLWSVATPVAACSGSNSGNKVRSSPAVGPLHGDGVQYVVIGYGGLGDRQCDGGVAAYRGTDGAAAWVFSTKVFSERERFWAFRYSVLSTPALADTDGDGKMEVGFGSLDRNVYLLNHDGTVRWYYNAADTVWSSAAFANVAGDGRLELIIGTDISANSRIRPPTKNGGFVYAFKTEPRRNKKITFRKKGAYYWQAYLDQVVYSSPVVAEVLASSRGPEVIVASGCFFPQRSGVKKNGRWLKVLNGRTGKVVKTLVTSGCSPSSAAVGDIDDDGRLEIIATSNGSSIGGDGFSRVSAWNAERPAPLWSVIPRGAGDNDSQGGDFLSPVVADLDGNGSLEVIAGNSHAVSIFNGADGTPLTCQTEGCTDLPILLRTGSTLRGTPAVADINRDGRLDVVIGSGSSGRAALYAWTNFAGQLQSPPGRQTPFSAAWPMARGNPLRAGAEP